MLGTLDTLLAAERSPESIVAYRGKQALTLGMLRQDVARLAHWLGQQPGSPSRWALCWRFTARAAFWRQTASGRRFPAWAFPTAPPAQ